jgi:hypothetical protein
MVEINPEAVESFTTAIDLKDWLRPNHDRSEELWIKKDARVRVDPSNACETKWQMGGCLRRE